MCLRPAETTVRADLALEGGHLLELWVVATIDHQVGGGAVRIDVGDLLDGSWSERFQWVEPDNLAGSEVADAMVAQHYR